MIEGEERNETETTGAVGPDVHVGYAAEPTQQLNNDHLAEIWGIKSVGAKIKETQQKKEVTKLTLDMMNDSLKDVLRRKRKTELERTIARISDRIKALRECNAELESLMIQAGNPPQEVAALNYQNEVGLDVYLDMQSVVEEMLETCEPQKQEQKGSDVDTDKKPLDAKLIKLPITKYDGDPLRWLEFWEQFDIAVHSRKLENVIKFSYLREYLSGKAAAVLKGIPIKSENYKIAIERLKKEYGSDAKVRSAHIKAIRDIQSVQSISNLPKLRQFYEVVATNYASLESMGYKDHVLCLVEETIMKLPRIARYEITKEDREWTKWGFDKFLEKFWDYLRACEDIEPIQSIPAERDTGKRETPRFYSGKPKSESSTILSTTSHTRSCVYCNDTGHCSTDCTKLKGSQERKAFLQHTHRCYNCTGTKHLSKDCRSTRNCAHCNERHHTSICLKKAKTLQKEPSLHITNGPVAYQTVQAKIGGILCRALLDSGSGQSYVSREHARKLDIRPCREESRVIGTVNGDMNVQCPIYELEVQGIGEWSKTEFKTQFARLNVSVLSTVPNVHPEIAKENYIHLHDIKFSDISVKEALPIHAILGVKDYAHIKMGNIRKGKDGDPIAEETALGWTLMGHLYESKEQKTNINLAIDKETTIQEDSRRLWDLDVLGIKDDEEMYAEFKDSIKQNEDGRYCVKLPWKQGSYFLPDNRTLAEQRVRSQLKRMSKQPELLKEYDNIIRQQEEQGIIEPVPEKPDGDRIHYIPHHCVVREQAESTKVRIVYDASAKERKYARSLNDCLHIGPALQPLLYDILIRVRLHKSVLIGDIKKAFLQIEVVPEDRDALRFLWVESIKDEPPKIRELRFNRVIFGAGPSPFLLNATLQHHIKKYDTDPAFVKQVLKSLYCDDFVGVSNSTEELVELKIKLEQRLKEGKFEMHKWKSNDPSLREICATEEASMTKVLGIQWNTSTDNMSVNFSHVVENENSLTQRGLLRTTASIFDPLGIGSPVTISAKIIYHEVCLKRLGWDTQIPSDQARLWDSWVRSIKRHPKLQHNRCVIKHLDEPILLPRDHLFTTLVIKDAHRKVLHLGVSTTLAEVRQKYWVPKGRQVVKKILKNCQRCKILSAKPLPSAATSALPECRVKSGHAFETIGVDFAGPFYCSNGRKTIKAYITLFTCATSRAVHIEAATDMSVNTFKQSLRSFITRRGMPSRIISDNAQTFKSAAKWLKKLKNSEEVNNFLESKGINWQFNVARAPWWGGFFERLIGLVKSCLMKILGRAKISFKEFKECLLDVEATLNNRPLTYLDEEFGPEALTPNHLIHGRRIPTLAWEEPESDNEIDATRRWKHLQKQLQHFWKRWNREYVSSLREHHHLNSRTTKNSLKPGAIVLIQQEGVSKSRWKLGRVDRLIEGKDGIIRGAVLKVVSNDRIYTVERPIQRLCLLELYAEESNVKGTIPDQTEALRRSTRDAAAVANVKIKNIRDISENQDFV